MKYYPADVTGPTPGGLVDAEVKLGVAAGTTFAFESDGVWEDTFARNVGDPLAAGPNSNFSILNYHRSNDVFRGAAGADNQLLMGNGKFALFLDDPYSANGDSPRLENIQQILCGSGGQLVDLTSERFTYGSVTIQGGSGNDVLWANAGNDAISGGGGNDNLWGGSGHDELSGGSGKDVLRGGAGNDTVRGGQDNDNVSGGDGNDSIFGDTGRDTLSGNGGDDYLTGGDGNDRLSGGNGSNKLLGGKGADKLSGGHNSDRLEGNTGADTLNGGGGTDVLFGHEDNDVLNGGNGNDQLHGDGGNDRLSGGAGNDVIYGNKGSDVLSGGSGKDRFVWLANEHFSTVTGSSVDLIRDFTKKDVLDFSDLIDNEPFKNASDFVFFDDTADGIKVYVATTPGGSLKPVVTLEDFHGASVADAQKDGWLII